MSNTRTPIQATVISHLTYKCNGSACMADMCAYLEQTTRYARYTIERAALELVELGVLVQEGNLVMLSDTVDATAECMHTAPACGRCI